MINPGNILLYKAPGNTLANSIAKGIRLITGNEITHVALYLGVVNSTHIILDALTSGVFIKSFTTEELLNRPGGFVLAGISTLKSLAAPAGTNFQLEEIPTW